MRFCLSQLLTHNDSFTPSPFPASFPHQPSPSAISDSGPVPFPASQATPFTGKSKVQVVCSMLLDPSGLRGRFLSFFSSKPLTSASVSAREGPAAFREQLRNSATVRLLATGAPPAMVAAGDGKTQMRNPSISPRCHILSGSKGQAACCQIFTPLGNALGAPSCQPKYTLGIIYGEQVAHQVQNVSFPWLVLGDGINTCVVRSPGSVWLIQCE